VLDLPPGCALPVAKVPLALGAIREGRGLRQREPIAMGVVAGEEGFAEVGNLEVGGERRVAPLQRAAEAAAGMAKNSGPIRSKRSMSGRFQTAEMT